MRLTTKHNANGASIRRIAPDLKHIQTDCQTKQQRYIICSTGFCRNKCAPYCDRAFQTVV
eukprot:4486798-Amphidinium_carterae.1